MFKNKLLVSVTVFLLMLVAAAPAGAAPAVAAPVRWSTVDVTVHSEQSGSSTLLVAGTLPDSSPLPADVELAVPKGAQIQWAGEILGGPVQQDPSVSYTKSVVSGRDVYRFRLTKARTGQIEAVVPDLVTKTAGGYASALSWTPSQDVPEVRMNVRLPRGAQVQKQVAGAALVPAENGGPSYYSKSFRKAKAGKPLDLSFEYSVAASPASSPTTSGGTSSTFVLVLILLVAAGGAAALATGVSRKLRGKKQDEAPAPAVSRTPKTGSPAVKERGLAIAESPEADEAGTRRGRLSGSAKVVLLAAGLIGVVLTVSLLGARGASAQWVEGKLTKEYAAADACSKAELPLDAGSDVREGGPKLLDALRRLEGIRSATVYEDGPKIVVDYCDSATSEDEIRRTLAKTGLLKVSQAPDGAEGRAVVDKAAKKQTVEIDVSSEAFAPAHIVAKAGIPVEVAFTQGSGCVSEVVFPSLGVRAGLTSGPMTVKLPALEKGDYAFACGMGHQQGTLTVQ